MIQDKSWSPQFIKDDKKPKEILENEILEIPIVRIEKPRTDGLSIIPRSLKFGQTDIVYISDISKRLGHMTDGSIDSLTIDSLAGILKAVGGLVSVASPGVDYSSPSDYSNIFLMMGA